MRRTHARGSFLTLAAFVFVAVILPDGLQAQQKAREGADGASNDRLREVEQQLSRDQAESERLAGQARALDRDLNNLRKSLVSAARIVQDRELRVITLEARIADLVRQEKEKMTQLAANRAQFGRVLVALQRMAQFPPEALLAHAGQPNDMVRSAVLLRSVVPEIDRRALALRDDLESLARTRSETARQRLSLTTASQDLTRQRAEIRRLMQEKQRLRDKSLAESRALAKKVAKLAAQARDLKDLLARLEQQRRFEEKLAREETARRAKAAAEAARRAKTEAAKRAALARQRAAEAARKDRRAAMVSPSKPFRTQKGRLALPVVGRLVGRYGEAMDTGLARKGIDIAARAGAQVVATYDGKVAYAGTFRGYGQLLIIDHGDGYHSLLAGMARIDVAVGQKVSAGEPVGEMGDGSGGGAMLYVELRRKGQPINPTPWLAARGGLGQG